MNKTLHRWELALLLALAVTLLWGAWSLHRQDQLAEKMIRLHIVANSDSPQDQALKLCVRDKVIAFTTSVLESSSDMVQAQQRLRSALPVIKSIAADELQRRGCADTVRVELGNTEFPRKTYTGFALPGGEYLALRVLIGEAAGQNWWCVVFPPLCTAASTDLESTAIAAGLDQEDLGLMTEDGGAYVLKFRSVELWEALRRWLHK